MLPKYVLPAQNPAATINPETNPEQARHWLARLPHSDPIAAAIALRQWLFGFNRSALHGDVRGQLLALIEPSLVKTLATLLRVFQDTPLPLNSKQNQLARLAFSLLEETALTRKIAILDWLRTARNQSADDNPPLCLQQLFITLQQILELSYTLHEPPPAGVWRDLHQSYLLAVEHQFTQRLPEQSEHALTIETLYKFSISLAIADPYRLPQHEHPWARELILRFVDHAGLEVIQRGQPRAATFGIDAESDTPVIALARDPLLINHHWHLRFNSTGLVKYTSLLANQLKNTPETAHAEFPESRNPAYPAFLERVRKQWSAAIQRTTRRRESVETLEYDACFGLDPLLECLTGRKQGAPSDTTGKKLITRCTVVNASIGGLALAPSKLDDVALSIGELVGIRRPASEHWDVGLLRWFVTPSTTEAVFGLQLLAPNTQLVGILLPQARETHWGLLSPAHHGMNMGAMLLAPPNLLKPGMIVTVSDQNSTQQLRLGRMTELSLSMSGFRFQAIRTARP